MSTPLLRSVDTDHLAPYPKSRDYVKLARLASRFSIACVVYENKAGSTQAHLATTLYHQDISTGGETWQVTSSGKIWMVAYSERQFIRSCAVLGLEFLVPVAAVSPESEKASHP